MLFVIWFLILAVIVGGFFFVTWASRDHDGMAATVFVLACLLAIAWIIISICGVSGYVQSISDYGDLRGVRDSFVSVEKAIEMTKESRYVISEKMLFDAANLKQSTNVSEAIAAARNTILEYNRKLQKYITLRSFGATRYFCAPVPADLKPLVWSDK
jgi:hypothetical protein